MLTCTMVDDLQLSALLGVHLPAYNLQISSSSSDLMSIRRVFRVKKKKEGKKALLANIVQTAFKYRRQMPLRVSPYIYIYFFPFLDAKLKRAHFTRAWSKDVQRDSLGFMRLCLGFKGWDSVFWPNWNYSGCRMENHWPLLRPVRSHLIDA